MKKTGLKTSVRDNRLSLFFIGRVTKKEMEKLYTDVRFSIADLQPGFDVISDLSKCLFIDLSGLAVFRKIVTYLITNEVGEVVRVMNRKRVISRQIVNLTLKMQGYIPVYVDSFDEAETHLNAFTKRNGIRFHLHNCEIKVIQDNSQAKGRIANISTSGCAVEAEGFVPEHNIPVTLLFSIGQNQENKVDFVINGDVVRADGNTFAVRFTEVDKAQQDKLWDCFVYESQKELVSIE